MKDLKKKFIALALAFCLAGTQAIPALALGDNASLIGDATVVASEESVTAEDGSQLDAEGANGDSVTAENKTAENNDTAGVDTVTGATTKPGTNTDTSTGSNTGADADSKGDAAAQAYGVYKPDSFTATGGTGKVKITCPAVKNSKDGFLAKVVFSSKSYKKMVVNGVEYKGAIDEANKTSTFIIPITPNADNTIIATTYAMSEPHDIEYVIKATWTAASAKSDESFQLPGEGGTDGDKNPSEKPGDKPQDTTQDKLADGTYKVISDTDNRMFYIPLDAKGKKYTILKKENGKLQITMALTGTGYDALYLGTMEEADKASKDKWIKFSVDNKHYVYTFEIPALDTELKMAAHSSARDRWYQHTVIFKSTNAVKIKAGTSAVPAESYNPSKPDVPTIPNVNNKPSKPKDDKQEKPSVSHKDTNRETSAVDNKTGLKDGVYALDSFSWSGGSGRLAYILCTKLTVTNGQAYATIEFGSPSYDLLKANGRVYSKSGGGMSTFTIPVQLNANNTIVGRTVAMSQPHWISYTIYPYIADTGNAKTIDKDGKATDGKAMSTVSNNKLTKKAPKIAGLKYVSTTKVKNAKNFKIFNYEKGVTLIQISMTKNSALKYKEKDKDEAEKVEYDDDGKPIAKSAGEITEELYHSKVVNYLVVPKGVEVPAGLEKEMIIVQRPVNKTYTASKAAVDFIEDLDISKKIAAKGKHEETDYKEIIKNKINLAFFSGKMIPEKDCDKKEAKELKAELEKLEKRFATLGIPLIIDRSAAEKDELGKAEWVKVYGAVYGCQKKAKEVYDDEAKEIEKKLDKKEADKNEK